jgi:hypothetical protein
MMRCKSKLSKTITTNDSTDVPNRTWEEDELSPALRFPLNLWQNICIYLKNKRLIFLTTYFNIYIYIYIDYYRITTVTYTYQKSSASASASATCALNHSRLSCF